MKHNSKPKLLFFHKDGALLLQELRSQDHAKQLLLDWGGGEVIKWEK